MKTRFSLCIFLIFLISSSLLQSQDTKNFFNPEIPMPVGVYYYPEHWDRNQWARDFKKMSELGFSFTHMAEFAWAKLEPEEGKYDFEWLDWCIAEAAKNGLKVILCTPTPCPPVWLSIKHPEILIVNNDGIRQQPAGNRLYANQQNPVYRAYIEKIVTELAKRYGKDNRVWGWQIDNEPHLSTLYDYSDFAQSDFRNWLKIKYSSNIDFLNKAWGNSFWSSTFNSFDQISIPDEKAGSGNPHAFLDFKRFTAEALAASVRFQSGILRKFCAPKQWVTTNYAYYKFLPSVDLFRNRGDMDFASHTMYLLSTFLNYPEGDLNFRLGSGMELSLSAEMAKSIEGYTGIMELQPGQINWGTYNSQPLPGAVRMWLWHSFGLGDKFICTYRFRQPLFGGEQNHKGIIETDGITVSRGGKEYIQVIGEINSLSKYKPDTNYPASLASRKTAFLWKQDNLWEIEGNPHTKSWNTWQHYYAYYENLKTMGAPVTFIREDDKFDPKAFPFMIAPAYSMIDSSLINKWTKYVEAGGNLILSCRTGQKDNTGHFHETLLQQPIWNLIGAKIEDNDQLPPERKASVIAFGQKFTWNIWGELISEYKGTEVLANYDDQFYAGKPASVTRKVGKGTVTYIGVWSDKGALEKQILRTVYQRAGANILNLPNYAFVDWRDGFLVGVNYTSDNVTLPIPEKAKMIFGNKIIKPGEVAVWME